MISNFKNHKKEALLFLLQFFIIFFTWQPVIQALPGITNALASEDKLAAKLKRDIGFFFDFNKIYACAVATRTDPTRVWDRVYGLEELKVSLHIDPFDQTLNNQVSSPPLCMPQYIALVMPLTALPVHQAIITFELVSLLLAIISISLLRKKFQKFFWLELIFFWLMVLGSPAFFQNTIFGQSEILIAGLAAIFLLTWENNQSLLAPVALAFIISIKPHQSIIMLIMSMVGKRYRIFFLTLLFSLVVLIATGFALGWAPLIEFPGVLVAIFKGFDEGKLFFPLCNTINLAGVISFFSNRYLGRLISWFSTVVFLILVVIIWRTALNKGRHTYPFAYACSLLLEFVLGPYENFYSFVLFSTAWAMTLPTINLADYSKPRDLFLRVWLLAFWLTPYIGWQIVNKMEDFMGPAHAAILLVLLVVAFLNLRAVLRNPTE